MTDEKPWTRRFRQIRVVEFVRARNVTPLMRRVTLGGPEAAGLQIGPVVKLLIPPPGHARVEWPGATKPLVWPDKALQPIVRTYSVRGQDQDKGDSTSISSCMATGPPPPGRRPRSRVT